MNANPMIFAGAILLSKDGAYILQLRDDNPSIVDPGKLSLFAGRLQPSETHQQAIGRVLREETGLELEPDNIVFYRTFEKDPVRHQAGGATNIYVVKDVDPAKIQVRQGQGCRLVDFAELNEENTALISYDVLKQFVADQA